MLAFHPIEVLQKRLPCFYVGDYLPSNKEKLSKRNEIAKDFRKLDTKLRSLGYYKTHMPFYYREALKLMTMWFIWVYMSIAGPNHVVNWIFSSLIGSFLWHQVAFVGHDLGHNGVTHNKYRDNLLGILFGNILGGVSIGWWKKSHNVHHIITNSPEHDPDIQHMPFFAVSKRFLNSIYSTFHGKVLVFDNAAAFFLQYQHYLMYIILMFGRYNLYLQSYLYVIRDTFVPYRSTELFGLTLFWAWYLTFLSHLPSWSAVFISMFITHAGTLLLHVQISVSHWSMSCDDVEDEGFAEKALRTTMDVECPPWLDWLHGGLQVKIPNFVIIISLFFFLMFLDRFLLIFLIIFYFIRIFLNFYLQLVSSRSSFISSTSSSQFKTCCSFCKRFC